MKGKTEIEIATPEAARNLRKSQAGEQPEKCPNCNRILHYYDGCLGYEAMRCNNCGYERDLNAAANAKATAERKASEKTREPFDKFIAKVAAIGKPRIRVNRWGKCNGYIGTRKVIEFGTRLDEAQEWFTKQTGLPAPSGTVKQGRRPMFMAFKAENEKRRCDSCGWMFTVHTQHDQRMVFICPHCGEDVKGGLAQGRAQ
jgi:DNA-directed RNA polymerase subunit M/transcription elongation factor TFIIS